MSYKTSQLHLVCGQPGVGKTTWGKNLARQLGATFLDIDVVTEPIVKAALKLNNMSPNDRDSALFKRFFREPIYSSLYACAADNLDMGDVVIAGPFTKELQNENWHTELVERFLHPVRIYWLTCSEESLKQRILSRNNPRDRSKLENWDGYQAYFKTASEPKCLITKIVT